MTEYLDAHDVAQRIKGGDLTDLDLSDADTDDQSLDFTNCKGVIDAGFDERSYRFLGIRQGDDWRIKAGCRWFTFEEALTHWGRTCRNNPEAIGLVRKIMEEASKVPGQSEIGFGEL